MVGVIFNLHGYNIDEDAYQLALPMFLDKPEVAHKLIYFQCKIYTFIQDNSFAASVPPPLDTTAGVIKVLNALEQDGFICKDTTDVNDVCGDDGSYYMVVETPSMSEVEPHCIPVIAMIIQEFLDFHPRNARAYAIESSRILTMSLFVGLHGRKDAVYVSKVTGWFAFRSEILQRYGT